MHDAGLEVKRSPISAMLELSLFSSYHHNKNLLLCLNTVVQFYCFQIECVQDSGNIEKLLNVLLNLSF